MPNEDLNQMTTGEVAKRAKQAGVQNTEGMNKQQMIEAMGGKQPKASRAGQGREPGHAPAAPGSKPSDWKNQPGNQS